MGRRSVLATTAGLLTASSAGCLRLMGQETATATPSEGETSTATVEVEYIDARWVNNREGNYALDIKLGTVENVTGDDVYIVADPVSDSHSEFGEAYVEDGQKRTFNANDDLAHDEDITVRIYETDARNNTLALYRFDSTDGRFTP